MGVQGLDFSSWRRAFPSQGNGDPAFAVWARGFPLVGPERERPIIMTAVPYDAFAAAAAATRYLYDASFAHIVLQFHALFDAFERPMVSTYIPYDAESPVPAWTTPLRRRSRSG